jgi:hypothetical protein
MLTNDRNDGVVDDGLLPPPTVCQTHTKATHYGLYQHGASPAVTSLTDCTSINDSYDGAGHRVGRIKVGVELGVLG